jgi:tRNA (guanine-N7-)-methyltransferase
VRRCKRLPAEELAPYLVSVPETARVLDWTAVFGNAQPVEIEVGFGKGLFLITAARANPHVNFFGLEIVRKYQLYTANRLAKRKLSNVRVACADALLYLRDRVAPESVQDVHVYFPDPWWKKRHHKRRLFSAEFARAVDRILDTGGLLHLVTDVEAYFRLMLDTVSQNTALHAVPPPSASEPEHDLDYLTNFERKFRKEGRPIFRAAYAKGNN